MKGREIYFLIVLVLGFAGSAMGGGPVAVSPGGEGSLAIISQECPTFSWSQVEGVVSYRLKVFEKVGGIVGSYEAMEKMGGPAVSVEIKAPAFSWTPSGEQCLVSGERYVWYVGAVGSDGVERWSEGRGFEVEVGVSLGLRDALKETVNEYLTKEWISTASYKEVKESITSQMTKEVKGVGGGGVVASQTPLPLALEGDYNTFYGTGAGASITSPLTSSLCATFIGVDAGYSNTTGTSNTFLGYLAGYQNQTGISNTFVGSWAGQNNTGSDNTFVGVATGYQGSSNTFLGKMAGYSSQGSNNTFLGYNAGFMETGSNKLYIANSSTRTPLIYGDFSTGSVVINGILSIASSREYKENIDQLRTEEAMETLQNLKPVKFSYKATPSERHTGFISEEVPESLTTKERKAVSPMDIVAVLTKVVQEQQRVMEKQESIVREQQESLKELKTRNELLEQRLLALEGKTMAGR